MESSQRLIIDARVTNTAFEALDPGTLATRQSFARVKVETNDPTFASGADMQVAFYATGLREPFQDVFALDPVEAWEVDFARDVDQGIVDSWNDVVYAVLAVVPVGWNRAWNVCQRVHEDIAEKVSGISAANQFTDFVAMPPLSPLVHHGMLCITSWACRSRKVWPETKLKEFLMRRLRPDCLFTPSPSPWEEGHWAGSSIRRGRLSECLAVGCSASVLQCFMSHLGVGRSLVGHFTF